MVKAFKVILKIVLASSSPIGIPFADYLQSKRHLDSIITAPDKLSGRGRKLLPNQFSEHCATLFLKQYKPASHNELRNVLMELQPDLVITVAYGRLIRKPELEMPKYGWLNVHFSLLPRWRGASPVQQSILHGDAVSGVTVFRLDEGMDTGPVFLSKEHKLDGSETSERLLKQLSIIGVEVLEECLDLVEKGISPQIQSSIGITLAPKITKADGKIDWDQEAITIERKIRAMHPWPGAWCNFRGSRILINAAVISGSSAAPIGPSGAISVGQSIKVQCGDGQITLLEVTPEGKRAMSAAEWVRGLQNQNDLRFNSIED